MEIPGNDSDKKTRLTEVEIRTLVYEIKKKEKEIDLKNQKLKEDQIQLKEREKIVEQRELRNKTLQDYLMFVKVEINRQKGHDDQEPGTSGSTQIVQKRAFTPIEEDRRKELDMITISTKPKVTTGMLGNLESNGENLFKVTERDVLNDRDTINDLKNIMLNQLKHIKEQMSIITNLIKQISNLIIPNELSGEYYTEIKRAANMVPMYNGENIEIMQFIKSCKRALKSVAPSAEPQLVRLIISKLRGRAYAVVENKGYTEIALLTDRLHEVFGPLQSIDHYLIEFAKLYKKPNEHIIDYIIRVQDLKDALIESERHVTGNITNEKIAKIETEIHNKFIDGLPFNYLLRFKLTGNETLEETFDEAIKLSKRLELEEERNKNSENNSQGLQRLEPEGGTLARYYGCDICLRTNHSTEKCRANRMYNRK